MSRTRFGNILFACIYSTSIYTVVGFGESCTDSSSCTPNSEVCVGGTCTCNTNNNYYYNGNQCDLNIVECAAKTDDCHANAFCTDTDGSYRCTCKTGYTGDGRTCTDTGMGFTSNPAGFVIGSTGTLTLTCSVTENDVSQVYYIKIRRVIVPGSTTNELMASFVSGTATLDDGINDDKGFTVTGELSGALSRLELSMDISKLTCSDARLYICEIGYNTNGNIETSEQIITLQAFVLPQMNPPVHAKRNGNFIEGGTLTHKAVFDVGDQLELECRANIGSLKSTRIRWGKTSEMQDSDFIGYQPQEGTYDEGTPLNDNQCGFTRTAIIRYNVTAPVVGYDLGFECYVSVSGYPPSSLTQSGQYTTYNRLRYYIDVNVDECATSTHNCDTNAYCTDTAGSFTCKCINGYSGTGTAGTCTACIQDCSCTTQSVIVGVVLGLIIVIVSLYAGYVTLLNRRYRARKDLSQEHTKKKGIKNEQLYVNELFTDRTAVVDQRPCNPATIKEPESEYSRLDDASREDRAGYDIIRVL